MCGNDAELKLWFLVVESPKSELEFSSSFGLAMIGYQWASYISHGNSLADSAKTFKLMPRRLPMEQFNLVYTSILKVRGGIDEGIIHVKRLKIHSLYNGNHYNPI